MPRCSCQRAIAAGADAKKMIVEYQQDDGSIKVFGFGMSDGPLTAATGRLLRCFHYRCYWVSKKREARGDRVTGRVVPGTPTAYDIGKYILSADDVAEQRLTPDQVRDRSTLHLSARLARLREIAQQLGRTVGDAAVQEAQLAEQHAGPYPHTHTHRLDMVQLVAHLRYAHGVDTANDAHAHHELLHAQAANTARHRARAADGESEPPVRDWRTQHTTNLTQESPPS